MPDYTVVLTKTEIDALVSWHLDEEVATSGKRQYDDAKWHDERRQKLLSLLAPTNGQ